MTFVEVEFPGSNAAEPNLTMGPDGKIYLNWLEKLDGESTLRYARLEDNNWVDVKDIAKGNDWFVNWADFPSLLVLESGYVAHYLSYITEDKYSYGVNLVSSMHGDEWSEPQLAHDDGTPTEHGFVSLLPLSDSTYMAIWLDGRQYVDSEEKEATKEMTLRSAIFDLEGNKLDEDLIDSRTCDCCQTDAVVTKDGPMVVYRDRSFMEVRDIYISRFDNGEWLEPWMVYADGWEIPGCPVNGPAIDANDDLVSVAWFSAANGVSSVLVSNSTNKGEEFMEPVRVDLGSPLGRVDLRQFDDFAVVTWMEEAGDKALIYCRKVFNDGRIEDPIIIDESSASRSSGFPRMIRKGNDLVFAWTVAGDPSTIKTKIGSLNF